MRTLRLSLSDSIRSSTEWYLKLKAAGAPLEMQNGKVILLAKMTTNQDPESGDTIFTWESDEEVGNGAS